MIKVFILYLFFFTSLSYSMTSDFDDLLSIEDVRINSVTARILLIKDGEFIEKCTGVLIAKNRVLSAAHCAKLSTYAVVIIGKGKDAQFIYTIGVATLNMPRKSIALVEDGGSVEDFKEYAAEDLIIFNLASESKFEPLKILPIRDEDIEFQRLLVAGFPGRGDYLTEETIYPEIHIAKNVSNFGACYFLSSPSLITDDFFSTDCIATSGNSGGPLFTYINDELYLLGILSSGVGVEYYRENFLGENDITTFYSNIHRPEIKKWLSFFTEKNN